MVQSVLQIKVDVKCSGRIILFPGAETITVCVRVCACVYVRVCLGLASSLPWYMRWISDYFIDMWADGYAASTCGEAGATTTTSPAAAAKVRRSVVVK